MITHPKENIHNRKWTIDDNKSNSYNVDYTYSTDDKEKKQNKQTPNLIEKILNDKFYCNVLGNIILFVSIISYLVTLIGCDDPTVICLKNLRRRQVLMIAVLLMLSSFLFTLIYTLFLYKKIHYTIPIYTTVIIWFLTYVYDTGADMKSHGSYNRVFLFTFMPVSFIFQQFIILIIYLIKKVGKWKGSFCFLILSIAAVYMMHHSLIRSCDNWTKGLKNTEIDMRAPGCKIKVPYYCWMNFMDNKFDVSSWLGEKCENMRMDDKDQVLRWTKVRNARIIGYPRVEKWKYFPDSTIDYFQFKVLAHVIDMEDPNVDEVIKNNIEVIVDYSLNKPEMKVRVKRDEKLIQERREIREKLNINDQKFISKNVIHLFIDSLSRDNFRRKMPLTMKWLEKYFQNKSTDARSYQFFKYQAVASWTYVNMVPSMFGVESGTNGSPIHVNKYYKDRGFIMSQAHNNCGREFYDLELKTVDNYIWEPFDHEANILSCDPNYTYPGLPFNIFTGPFGFRRRCLYGKDTSHHIIEYSKEFWKAYLDQPKYLRLAFVDAHEGTGEVVKYMDDLLVDFLDFLDYQGSLKDTVILLQSDHGTNMPGFYSLIDAEDTWIEKTLPSLFMVVPQDVANKYGEILSAKENYLLSPYDFHNTLLHLADAPLSAYNNIGESFFLNRHNYVNRTCNSIKVIDPAYCQCIDE